jgi:glutamate--cysteine ligase
VARGHGEEAYLAPIDETLRLGKTPAERWLQRYMQDWGGDIYKVFDEAEI